MVSAIERGHCEDTLKKDGEELYWQLFDHFAAMTMEDGQGSIPSSTSTSERTSGLP